MSKAYERVVEKLRRRRARAAGAGEPRPGERRPAARALVRRSNLRHQWEKDRARQPAGPRTRTGVTERDTGLAREELVFGARYGEVLAGEELAGAFQVPVGTALLERTYRTRHRAEQSPFSIVRSYLPRDLVAANPALLDSANEPWPGGTQNQLFTVGVEVDRVEERVTARPPTPAEVGELGLPSHTAVLRLRKTSYDIDGRVVEVCDITLPGDRSELLFTTPLERW